MICCFDCLIFSVKNERKEETEKLIIKMFKNLKNLFTRLLFSIPETCILYFSPIGYIPILIGLYPDFNRTPKERSGPYFIYKIDSGFEQSDFTQ